MNTLIQNLDPVLQLLVVMACFSFIPFIFTCMTSFMRYAIVFSFLKQAMGTQSIPPAIVLVGLSLIMTFYSMGGVFQDMWEAGSVPYQKSHSIVEAVVEGSKPLKEFMLKNTRETDMAYFLEKSRGKAPESPDEITIWEVAPAFILSELKTSFEIGFIIYIPFIVLDMIVANVLLALGMFMLSPTIISLPFKLLIFIAVDGWSLVVHGLAGSYN
ncbi:MAG: flagellar type III secretion system pore protein FliP [Candidatus Gastranaerophilales bacterium]|nr:flagellar type III secretion system pore protein FliP [Candidatus Gastranaerophilales bacterium]